MRKARNREGSSLFKVIIIINIFIISSEICYLLFLLNIFEDIFRPNLKQNKAFYCGSFLSVNIREILWYSAESVLADGTPENQQFCTTMSAWLFSRIIKSFQFPNPKCECAILGSRAVPFGLDAVSMAHVPQEDLSRIGAVYTLHHVWTMNCTWVFIDEDHMLSPLS